MPSIVCCVFPFPPQILDRCAVWPLGNSPNRPSQVNHLGGERTTALFIYAPKIGILNIYHTFHLMSFSAPQCNKCPIKPSSLLNSCIFAFMI